MIFEQPILEELCKILGEYTSGSQITTYLTQLSISDIDGPQCTKWRRLYSAFAAYQNHFQDNTKILEYICLECAPSRFVNNEEKRFAPFMDATGAHAGALLGDVRHDPYQSGGLGTPAHERVESGMIHKAHKGVLYIDEIGTMSMKTQQELLSAMQEKKYSITGQSENSSGAMVRSQAVPCDFVLVASGNLQVLEGMHIAMRSRIRGYGYEVFMKDYMLENLYKGKNVLCDYRCHALRQSSPCRFLVEQVLHSGQIQLLL